MFKTSVAFTPMVKVIALHTRFNNSVVRTERTDLVILMRQQNYLGVKASVTPSELGLETAENFKSRIIWAMDYSSVHQKYLFCLLMQQFFFPWLL